MEKIFFAEQTNGYDKKQVDNYIQKLTEAYQKAYNEYFDTYNKYNVLIQNYKKLESEKQVESQMGLKSDIIEKILLDAEKLAKDIINNAHSEEARIVDLTVKNLQYAYKTLENAMSEVQKFLAFNNFATGENSEWQVIGWGDIKWNWNH